MKNNIALGENWIFSFAGPIFFYSRPPKTQYNHGIEIAGALKYDLKQFFFRFQKKSTRKSCRNIENRKYARPLYDSYARPTVSHSCWRNYEN